MQWNMIIVYRISSGIKYVMNKKSAIIFAVDWFQRIKQLL